jgi:hypothetical protein
MPDILDRSASPALSTTSDAPVIDAAEPAEPVVADPKLSAEPEPEPQREPDEPAEPAPAADEKPGRFAKRLGELTHERDAAHQTAQQLAESLREALAAIKQLTPKPADAPPPPADVRPQRPDRMNFDTPEAYESALDSHADALVEWSARNAAKSSAAEIARQAEEARVTAEREAQEKTVATEREGLVAQWHERVAKYTEDHPDFQEKVIEGPVQITEVMGEVLIRSEVGPQIAQHLADNPDLAAKISKLPPAIQIYEIGKLDAILSTPANAALPARLPSPIPPTRASNRSTQKTPDEMTTEEYAAMRGPMAGRSGGNTMFGGRTN